MISSTALPAASSLARYGASRSVRIGRRPSTIRADPSTFASIETRSALRVAILLAGHLRLGDLLDQLARAPGHDPRVDDQGVDPLLELVDVGAELGRERSEAVGGAVLEEHLLDLVEALEPWILDAAVEVLLAEVDGLVQVREELGDRLDPLPRDAGRRVERLRPREVAALDRGGERPDLRDEVGHLLVDVGGVAVAHGVELRLVDDRVRRAATAPRRRSP